jgi:glyoxylase-like metal-dependent hydrolase (beta-lactamase superfamily II)
VNRVGTLAALIVLGSFTVAIGSQRQTPARADVELQRLKDNLYLLVGGGGNSAALVTDLGVVLVDTKLAGWGQPMLDKLKTVTSKPVTTIINTHAHGDSVSGNEFFPTSVEIIAQQNTRLNMDKLEAFKGVKVNFLPKLMFKEKMTIGSGRDRVDLYYFGAGHTGGDAWVVFPGARVMHAGDMLMSRQPPIIDFENGGSGLAYSDTLAGAARLKNIDAVIPSHGPMMTMKDVEEYAQFNREFRDAAVSGFNHGLGVSEVADAWKLPDKYRGYTAPPDRVKANVRAIFSELTR